MTPSDDRPDDEPAPTSAPGSPAIEERVVDPFVEHWGQMARSWGINATMGELFALLYITGADWSADDLRERLRVSRGNVSMNLRELIHWGVVHKVNRLGERREFYRAELDVWTLFRRILAERKRRELDPTLDALARSVSEAAGATVDGAVRDRLRDLQTFFGLIDALAKRLLDFEPGDLAQFRDLLVVESPSPIDGKPN